MSTLMNTYGERTLTLTKGEGSRVWDDQGNSYIDGICGIAVCGLGHSNPAITQAIAEQAGTLLHVSNLYNIPPQRTLADKLCQASGMERAFFSNSGAEANEAAIKIARKYGNDQGIENPTIVVMNNAFHGRTMATLSATGNTKVQQGFEPLLSGFIRVPFNDIAAIEALTAEHKNIVAVLVEPVQGEGGVQVPAADYLPRLRQLCDQHQWLLMLDEIQTGNGRTGKYFAYQHHNIKPDVVTTAKGLGNGVPIGACLSHGKASEVFGPGNHGSTFGGNPLACHAACVVVDALDAKMLASIAQRGEQIREILRQSIGQLSHVVEIRGQGLMIGIELNKPCPELVNKARQLGLLINVTAGNTIRLLPTYVMTDEQTDELVNGIITLVEAF